MNKSAAGAHHRKPMKLSVNNGGKQLENQWNYGKSMKTFGKRLEKPMKIMENRWKQTKTDEHEWKMMENQG